MLLFRLWYNSCVQFWYTNKFIRILSPLQGAKEFKTFLESLPKNNEVWDILTDHGTSILTLELLKGQAKDRPPSFYKLFWADSRLNKTFDA